MGDCPELPVEPSADCRRLLRRAFALGEQEHPSLTLSCEVFSQRAWTAVMLRASRLRQDVTDGLLGELVERIAAADLYLALACDHGSEDAWRLLSSRYEPRLRALAVRRGVSAADADETVTDLLGDLIAKPGEAARSTRLATYEGTGNLWSWLAVILVRRLAERARRPESGFVTPGETGTYPEPSRLVEDEETRTKLRSVLSKVWGELSDREALALLLKYRDGLPQTRIAVLLGVSEPRVSRFLGLAVERLRTELRWQLKRLGKDSHDGTWQALRDLLAERLQESDSRTDPLAWRREQSE